MKTKTKFLIPVVVFTLSGALSGCNSLRRGVIGLFSFEEARASAQPVGTSLTPSEPVTSKGDSLRLELVATGFVNITDIQFMPGDSTRAIVLQKNGKAWILNLKDDSRVELFHVPVKTDSELGLLGIAFHPDFAKTRKFYVHYNPRDDLSRVSEWQWVQDKKAGTVACTEQRVLLEVAQPYQNHNGGSLVFGPDGLLYVGLGDGGWRGDPENRSQDPKSLLGKMLRLDVNTPASGSVKPEIFASGLRNPWKYSFDSKGRLIAGDVGQDKWEEITFVTNGANLGWRAYEGSHCYNPAKDCAKFMPDATPPIAEYGHDLGKSVTGGFEYTGSRVQSLKGRYIFGDFVSGRIWSIELPATSTRDTIKPQDLKSHGKWDILISTFARDDAGEIYVGDFGGGGIYRISR